MSVQVSYKKQFVLGIMFLIVVLLVIEGFARVYDFQEITDCHFPRSDAVKHLSNDIKREMCYNFRELEFTPYKHVIPNQHFPTININEFGFRGSEITEQKPNNTYRIFVIGGSSTFGTGSTSDNTTIPGYLQKKFDSIAIPLSVEVINAGHSGGFSSTETLLIKERILDLDPDLIIVYDGWNDVKREFEKYDITKLEDIDPLENFFRQIYKWTKTRGIIVSFIIDVRYSMGDYGQIPFQNDENPMKISIWKERWMEICEIGEDKKFKVIVTIQPALGSSERLLKDYEQKYYLVYQNEKVLQDLEKFAKALGELNQYCTKTADLRNVFDGIDSPIYTDYVHMSDFGNEIVAQKLFELALPIVKESGTKGEK